MSTNIVSVQPQLIDIGKRNLTPRRFTHSGLLDHLRMCSLQKKENKQWCSVKELASIFHNRATEANCAATRKSLTKAFPTFLAKGIFMAIEYAPLGAPGFGKKQAVKLYNGEPGLARQHAIDQVNRMRKSKEISERTYADACQLLLSFECEPSDAQNQA